MVEPARRGLLDRGFDAAKRTYAATTEWAGDKIEAGEEWVGDQVDTVKHGYAALESSDVGWSDGTGHVDADLDMWAPALPPVFRDTLVRDGGGADSNNRARLELDTNADRVSLRVPALRLAGLNLRGIIVRGVEVDDMVLSVEGVKSAARDLAKPHLPSALEGMFGAGGPQNVRLHIGRLVATGIRDAKGLEAGTIVATALDVILRAGESGLEGALGSAQGVSTSFELGSLAVTKAKHAAGSAAGASVHGLSGQVDPAHGRASVNIDDVKAHGVKTSQGSVGSAGVHGVHAAVDLDGDVPAMTTWRPPHISDKATGEASVAGANATQINASGVSVASAQVRDLAAAKRAGMSARLGGVSASGIAGHGANVKSVEASKIAAKREGSKLSGSVGKVRARQARAEAGSLGGADVKDVRFEHDGARDEVSVGGVYATDLAAKDLEVGSVSAADLHVSAAGSAYEGRAGWIGADDVSKADKQLVDRATLLDAHGRSDKLGISGGLASASVEDVSLDGTELAGAAAHGIDGTWSSGDGTLSISDAHAHGLHASVENTDVRLGWADVAGISASTGGGESATSIDHAAAGAIDARHELAATPTTPSSPSPVDPASLRASGSVRLGGEVSSETGGGALLNERATDNTIEMHADGLDDLAVSFVRMLVGQIHVDLGGARAGVERASASGGVVKVQGDGGGRAVHGKIGAVEVDGVTASKQDGAGIAAKEQPAAAELAGLVRDADLHGSVGLTPRRYGGSVLGATVAENTRADASVQVHDGKLVPGHTGVSIKPGIDLPGWFTADGVQLEADDKDPSKGRVRPQLGGLPDVEVTQFVPGMETGAPLDLKELAGTLPKPKEESK